MKRLITYLTAVAIVFQLFTPLRLFFEGGKALMLLIPTILIIMFDGLMTRKHFLPLALYIGSAIFTMLMGSVYFTIPSLLVVIFAFVCFEHYLLTMDAYFAKVVIISLYGTLLIMVGTSLPLFISIPNLSRLMLNAEENGMTSTVFFWALSYSDIHSLPIYSIPVFFLFRNTKKKILRIMALLFFTAIFVLMLYADSTGALMVNIAIFGILILYNQRKSIQMNIGRLAFLSIGVLLFLNKTVLAGILTVIQPIFAGSSTYKKIDEIILMIQGGESEGDMAGREEKFDLSWKSFKENPLFPTIQTNEYERIGGHNFLFDHITALGLFLSVFFIWFLIDRIKRPMRYLTFTAKSYYMVGVLAMLVMAAMKNFFLLLPTCCILPMILIAVENPKVIVIKQRK